MLEDFRQDKQEQPQQLDPLAEGSILPWSKKIVLLCLAVALIGLFIFFTSDSWSSEDKKEHHSKSKQEMTKEIEQIKARLSDLEQKMQPHAIPAGATTPSPTETNAMFQESSVPSINLQSLIEQELQDSHMIALAKEDDSNTENPEASPVQAQKKQASPVKKQSYTVQKGDSLSKISLKFYGTTKQWKKIVEANKDKLGRSQTLKPGMVLIIPGDGNEGKS